MLTWSIGFKKNVDMVYTKGICPQYVLQSYSWKTFI